MLIQTDCGNFNTDDLIALERNEDMSVIVRLDGDIEGKRGKYNLYFEGLCAQQVWAQVTEHAHDVDESDEPEDLF